MPAEKASCPAFDRARKIRGFGGARTGHYDDAGKIHRVDESPDDDGGRKDRLPAPGFQSGQRSTIDPTTRSRSTIAAWRQGGLARRQNTRHENWKFRSS